ncbi:2OG-Fe(II) oxygenase superfamily [Novymonas esmeraldas]|uniref:2OG-Fe(II) oxygenase superfamily n=1 Tax=Novymonas esmeraldas TaxID=1808958 RepID=A0AAW0F193_9TRYP
MLRISRIGRGTLVKIGRGPNNVTESASNALLESLQDHGYCYVQHPFIQKTILDQLHRDSRIFFEKYILNESGTGAVGGLKRSNPHNYNCTRLSPYELESIKAPSGFRGYYRYVGASGIDDAIDCFSVGRDDVADTAALRHNYYKQAGWEESEYLPMISRRNPWDVLLNHVNTPPGSAGHHGGHGADRSDNFMSDFKDMMVAYYDLCYNVSMDVMRHISCGLGIRPSIPQGGPDPATDYELEYFTAFHEKRDCDLQAKYYPKLGDGTRLRNGVDIENARSVQNPDGVKVLRRKGAKAQPLLKGAGAEDGDAGRDATVRLDTHKDLSTITLLSQDALGGLEVWDEEKGGYTAVPVLEDALLVNAGLFLEKWTGGLIEATPHRVRNAKGGNSRCSIIFFALPDHDARIEPLLQQEDNPAVDAQDSFLAGDMMPSP